MSKQMANAQKLYLRGIRDGEIEEVLNHYMGESYTQHSTGVADEKAGFQSFFTDFFKRNPKREIEIVRAIEEDQFVFVHVHQRLNDGAAEWITADIFRSDDSGRIVEHWDVIDAYQAPTAQELDAIHGEFEIRDESQTADNKKTVRRFLTEVFQNGEWQQWNQYVAEELIQHNREIGQGSQAYKTYAQEKELQYDFIFKIIAQGNYVVAYSKTILEGQAFAQFDIFRLENGKIIEHWDNKEVMPDKAELTNLGKF